MSTCPPGFRTRTFGGQGRVCETCHRGAGTRKGQLPDGEVLPSLSNAAAIFPRIADDQHTLITLADQVRLCVGGAVKGNPPDYGSDELNSLVAYVTSLSQGKAMAMGGAPR
jgi:thiosulfate dehydrogenase